MCNYRRLAVLFLAAVFLAGCGGSEVPRGAVQGRITLGGEPLAEGHISFEPTAGNKGPTTGAPIKDGHYEIPARIGPPLGKNKVSINANKTTGKKVQGAFGEKVDEVVEAVPKIYNVHSILQADVKAGTNELNFDLQAR